MSGGSFLQDAMQIQSSGKLRKNYVGASVTILRLWGLLTICALEGFFFVFRFVLFFVFVFLELHPWHMEISRLGIELEL